MNRLYIPHPTAWPSDPLGTTALKVMGLFWFMASVYGAVQFLQIMVR